MGFEEKSEKLAAVVKVIAGVLDLPEDELSLESGMHNTEGWNSLRQMQLMVSLERQFGLRFKMGELIQLTSVAKIYERISVE